MHWLVSLFSSDAPNYSAVAQALIVLGLAAAAGLAIGSVRIAGISLGVAGVLFAGLILAHFGLTIDPGILEFVREFGLILFVYSIGLQVGPGLIGSLRKDGLKLNGMALVIVILGVAMTIGIFVFADIPLPVAVGLFSGGTTNTPSLAAAQQALRDSGIPQDQRALPGLAYAASYPFGVLGLILAMLLLRALLRINLTGEREAFDRGQDQQKPHIEMINLEVRNPNLDGLKIRDIPLQDHSGIVISRVMHGDTVCLAQPDVTVHLGDVLLAVGPIEELDRLRIVVGRESDVNLIEVKSDIAWNWIIVTKKGAIGKSVHELRLREREGVTVTRIARADIELPVSADVRLQFGDRLSVVGPAENLNKAAEKLGNSPRELNHPMLVPLFIGIVLGVLVGSYPITLPGLPVPVKLGIAGGPLLVAIILSRIGKIGPLVWYMPISANITLREIGISLFLACVGLRAGDRFAETLIHGDGLRWISLAAMITIVPPLIVGIWARLVMKMNFMPLSGMLAGSMTDPPVLAYLTTAADSEAPSIAYATVYPLTMFLRVLATQLLVMYLH
mgnify:CR=1 FL=1